MSVIIGKLDKLADLREDLAQVNAKIEEVIPQDLIDERNSLSAQCKDLEEDIKSTAAKLRTDNRHSFAGKLLQVVYTSKDTYPVSLVRQLPPRYLKQVTEVKEVWSIRKTAS